MIKNIMKNIGPKPSTDVAYLKGSEDPQLKADVKKAISTHHATGNNLLNVLYNKDKELYKKLDAMGTTNAEQFINQLAYGEGEEETTEDSPTPEAWKTSVIAKLDTSKLLEMDKNFENYKKTMNSVDKLAQERNDIVKAELRKRNSK